jgi:3-hydroxy acid dehydrogenase / malonic semialdehyde reductase
MTKTILITGATSGIGKSAATRFAANGYRLIITGRRKELLDELKKELTKTYHVEVLTLNFDVRDKNEVAKAINTLPEDWKKIDILVNNAGLASGLGAIQDGDIDDWEKMIDTNVKGLLYVTRAVSPIMIAQGSGHIINIGSIAGKEVYANGNVYCATKHAVDALTKAMRIDMLMHNIKVTQIAPGAAETEFSLVRYHGDADKAKAVYNGFTPLTPDDIADAIWYVATVPAHVNINDMVIMPAAQASPSHFNKKP